MDADRSVAVKLSLDANISHNSIMDGCSWRNGGDKFYGNIFTVII